MLVAPAKHCARLSIFCHRSDGVKHSISNLMPRVSRSRQPKKGQETLAKVLEIDPLNHLARFEQYLQEPGPGGADSLQVHDPD